MRYVNGRLEETAFNYARIINQYKFKQQAEFSTRFEKQGEDGQILHEIEVSTNLGIN